MRLKLYRAASMAEAMTQLRRELGPEALILSTRRVAGGVELTAALEPKDEPAETAEPVGQPRLDAAYHSIPPALAARLCGPDLVQSLRVALRFGCLPFPEAGQPSRPLLLSGPPGAGKTLSVARLATRLVLAGAQPLVITADARRAGGAEELAAYTRLLGLTLLAVSSPAALMRALQQAQPDAPILIDTAGVNPFEPAELAAISDLVEAASAAPVLVLAAGAHAEEAAEQADAFVNIGVSHLLPTRLDLARRLGSVLAAADTGLTLTEAGVGTGPTDGLVRITPGFLAGRLSGRACSPQPPATAPSLRTPVFPTARARTAGLWDV